MVKKFTNKNLSRSRQATTSDLSKQAKSIVFARWGGRWADGSEDVKREREFWNYVKKKRVVEGKGMNKMVYHYTTNYRRKWKSYNT